MSHRANSGVAAVWMEGERVTAEWALVLWQLLMGHVRIQRLGCGRWTSCFKASRQTKVQLHSEIMKPSSGVFSAVEKRFSV